MFRAEKDEKDCGIKKGGLFFSNSLEVLLEHLKVNLFPEAMDFFSDRILLTPSQGMHQWIQMQLASSLSIACGFTSTFLNKGITMLHEKLFYTKKKYVLPSQMELFLLLLDEIKKVLDSTDPLWKPLINFVQKKESRQITIAHHLAQLFERYGIYAHLIQHSWEKCPSNWQEALWAKIFKNWDYPQRILSNLLPKDTIPELTLHLFAFSHISPLHFYFFCKVSNYIPVYIYHLSPCQEFWSDLLPDHPSLLSNMGKLGREMAKLIEKSETQVEEAYLFFGGNTRLKQLQRELLTLNCSNAISEDDSIQIHVSTTPHQEIENLYDLLLINFASGDIEPKDVIVMAPQIDLYAPYIQSIFGKEIPYKIADMPLSHNQQLSGGFFLLLELEKKRWCAPAILALLGHPLFQKRQKFSEEDLEQIKKWIKKTGTSWAFDAEHRASLLQKSHCQKTLLDGSMTWVQSFDSLIEELALPGNERIQLSQAELLGNFITLLKELYIDLKAMETPKELSSWVEFFKKLIDKYFVHSEDSEAFCLDLEKIANAGVHFPQQSYRFPTVNFLLTEYLTSESITVNRTLCQAVHFCSMLPMRGIPAKIICLLGMNHAAFPRKDELQTLDLLKNLSHADYFPTRPDFDRYLFLEAILSARAKLIISYLGRDPFDLTEVPPSSVVAEFMPYLSPTQVYLHPIYRTSHILCRGCNFQIKTIPSLNLPKGERVIDISNLLRAVRSPLRHYLKAHDLHIEVETPLAAEEPFFLSPLKKSVLRKVAIRQNLEIALAQGEKEGAFPLGGLGALAQLQLKESNVAQKSLEKLNIKPLPLKITDDLTVIFSGSIEGIYGEGLCVADKKSFKNSAKEWPNFLLLKFQDAMKTTLHFAGSDESLTCFFDDAAVYLRTLVEYFFLAEQHPLYFTLDWLEAILKEDVRKLVQVPLYDPILQWQLRGREKINYDEIISCYSPIVKKLYGEMASAWF